MFFRVDMPNSNPPLFMVYNSASTLAAVQAPPLNCGQTRPMNLPAATPAGVQHTICNNSGANITVNIITT